MKNLIDYRNLKIRLTDERMAHIQEHPEMRGLEEAIEDTLLNPDCVIQSRSDDQANLYYRFYAQTSVGGKFLCVIVKVLENDAFVLTAYLTDKVKDGEKILWNKKT